MKRKAVSLSVLLVSFVLASCVLCIALDHNPQGEFHGSELGFNWSGVIALWSASFFLLIGLIGGVVWLVSQLRRIGMNSREKDENSNELLGQGKTIEES